MTKIPRSGSRNSSRKSHRDVGLSILNSDRFWDAVYVDLFEERKKFNVKVMASRHPVLTSYIGEVISQSMDEVIKVRNLTLSMWEKLITRKLIKSPPSIMTGTGQEVDLGYPR